MTKAFLTNLNKESSHKSHVYTNNLAKGPLCQGLGTTRRKRVAVESLFNLSVMNSSTTERDTCVRGLHVAAGFSPRFSDQAL